MSISSYAEATMLIDALLALALTAGSFTSQPSSASPAHTDSTAARHTTVGVAIAPVPERIRRLPYLEEDEGVVLTEVRSGGAAEAAHLRAGDIILAVDGKHVDESTLFAALRDCPRNRSVRVEFLRAGKWRETWMVLEA